MSSNELQPVVREMAARFQLDPAELVRSIKAQLFPSGAASDAQLLMFMSVANKYGLDPFAGEIFVLIDKHGRMKAVVGVDGWLKIVNRDPNYDGCEFSYQHGDDGELISVTCRIYRKDRAHPTEATEYMAECYRPDSAAWKFKARMLRHKAFIQCARYAFALTEIIDPDEADRIREAQRIEVAAQSARGGAVAAIEAPATPALEAPVLKMDVQLPPEPAPAVAASLAPEAEAAAPAPEPDKPKRGRPKKAARPLAEFVERHQVPVARLNVALSKHGAASIDELSAADEAAILSLFEKSYQFNQAAKGD